MAEVTVTDHDLLVRLDVKLDGISTSVNKIEASVALKADEKRVDALEKRIDGTSHEIDNVKARVWAISGGISAAGTMVYVVLDRLFGHLGR